MKLLFTPESLATFNRLKEDSPDEANQVREAIKDTLDSPTAGKGSPTPLSGALSGLWSRTYGVFGQIIYAVSQDTIKIYDIDKNFSPLIGSGMAQLQQTDYTEDEYRSVLAQMKGNRGKGEEPKVGIFWYNVGRDELFGVISHPVRDYSRANASDGRITCSELHEDIWKKEYRRQHYKGDKTGPYIGAYQDKPRGRVFYHIDNDTYEVATGKWIQDYPHVYDMILHEFNLPPEKTSAKYAIHWDIGQSWR